MSPNLLCHFLFGRSSEHFELNATSANDEDFEVLDDDSLDQKVEPTGPANDKSD